MIHDFKNMKFVSFCLFINILIHSDCARILAVFPTPSVSHQVIYRPLIQELLKRGHEVLVITTDPAYQKKLTPGNLTEIDLHDLSYSMNTKMIANNNRKKVKVMNQMKHIFNRLAQIHDIQFAAPNVKELLDSDKTFDLLIIEAFAGTALGFSHVFKAPVVLMNPINAFPFEYNMLGAPTHPLLYPSYVIQQRFNNLTCVDKVTSILSHFEWENYMHDLKGTERQIMRKHFGNDVPSLEDLYKNIEMFFMTIHPLWADNKPLPPNIKFIGGFPVKPGNPLPQELQSYLDSSINGVIYVSFGSIVEPSVLSPDNINKIMNVLSNIPFGVLFKWDTEDYPRHYENIMFSNWFPQSDLLKHPNIKLFITHGGLQSTDEAIDATVPLLGLPIFADQFYNVQKIVYLGIGLELDLNELTEEELRNSINIIMNDVSFKKNILKLRTVKQQNPVNSVETAAWWIEHIIDHGGSHFKSPASDLSWAKYYEVDLIVTMFLSIASVFIAGVLLLSVLWRSMYCRIFKCV